MWVVKRSEKNTVNQLFFRDRFILTIFARLKKIAKFNRRENVDTILGNLRENMSVKCIAPQTPLLSNKFGFAEEYLSVLFLFQNIHCGYSLVPPRRGGSTVYPKYMFLAKMLNNIFFFQ